MTLYRSIVEVAVSHLGREFTRYSPDGIGQDIVQNFVDRYTKELRGNPQYEALAEAVVNYMQGDETEEGTDLSIHDIQFSIANDRYIAAVLSDSLRPLIQQGIFEGEYCALVLTNTSKAAKLDRQVLPEKYHW